MNIIRCPSRNTIQPYIWDEAILKISYGAHPGISYLAHQHTMTQQRQQVETFLRHLYTAPPSDKTLLNSAIMRKKIQCWYLHRL